MKRENMQLIVVVIIAVFTVVIPILTFVQMEFMVSFIRGIHDGFINMLMTARSALLPIWRWYWMM